MKRGPIASGRSTLADPNPDPKVRELSVDGQHLRIVMPRRDNVAIGRGRTRARIDQLGNPASGRDRRHRGDRQCALLEIVSGILARRSLRDAERRRGSGARRARTWHDAVSSTRPNCILVGRGVGSMTRRLAQRKFEGFWRLSSIKALRSIWGSTPACLRSSRRKPFARTARSLASTKLSPSLTQVEHRCSLPFLHRLRGEILLKRDPADPAPAEEAFAHFYRHREGARRVQSRSSSVALARQALSIDRPPRRRPCYPRARPRRLFTDARNAGNRRSGGAHGAFGVGPLRALKPFAEWQLRHGLRSFPRRPL